MQSICVFSRSSILDLGAYKALISYSTYIKHVGGHLEKNSKEILKESHISGYSDNKIQILLEGVYEVYKVRDQDLCVFFFQFFNLFRFLQKSYGVYKTKKILQQGQLPPTTIVLNFVAFG